MPWLCADLARAAHGIGNGARAVAIAPDEQARCAAFVDAARAGSRPKLKVIDLPGWDCLPYDRASPALSVSARRLSALHQCRRANAGNNFW